MTVIDLFAGFGGFSIAAKAAGAQVVAACEIDRHAISVYRRHHPEVPMFVDITKDHDWPAADVVCFGSPCQDTPIAGQRKGLVAGERSGLFFEAIRVIQRVRPRFALWEQPPGVFSTHRGRDFAAVLDAFLDIGARDIGWRVLDSQFAGDCELHAPSRGWHSVPQRRRRIFLVADFGGRSASTVLSLREGLRGHPAPRRKAGEGVAATLGGGSSERGWSDDTDRMTFLPVCGTLAGSGAGTERPAGNGNELDFLIPIQYAEQWNRDKRQNGVGIGNPGDPMYTLDASYEHGIAAPLTAGSARSEGVNPPGRRREDDENLIVARCQTAGEGTRYDGESVNLLCFDTTQVTSKTNRSNPRPGGPCHSLAGQADAPAIASEIMVRRLTPLEAERLMGLEDRFTEFGIDGPLSDSARYRLLGNGLVWQCVAPILAAMAEEIA